MEILTHVQHAVVNQKKPKKNVHQLTHQKKVVNLNVQNLKNVRLRKILKVGILTKQTAMEQINLVQNSSILCLYVLKHARKCKIGWHWLLKLNERPNT